jgi:phosphoglycerate dehydrogenase-like enzyme
MRPNILIPVRERYRGFLLPERMLDQLKSFADIEVAVDPADLPRQDYAGLYRGRDAVLTTWNTPMIDREVAACMDRVRIISHCGGEVRPFISAELFDLKPELVLCNASNVMAKPVAEHTLCVALTLLRGLFHLKEWVKGDENWWDYDPDRNRSLLRKKVGVVGLGQIAREFIQLVRPFDVELWVHSGHLSDAEAAAQGLTKKSLEEIFSQCDVITVSAANTPANRHMVNRELLRLIKPGAVLVNNARGALIDEQALVDELRTGRFQAAIDVTDPEPPAAGHPLRDMPNVLLTPHTGGPVPEQRIWMMEEAVDNLRNFFSGKPVRGQIDKKRFSYMA